MKNHPDLVRDICEQEGLGTGALRPLNGGQTNILFRLGRRYVLRIGQDAEARERLRCEADLLRALAGRVPVPHVVAAGECRGVPYQVQEFVPGQPLHRAWRGLSADAREAIVAELASYLRALHGMAFATFGGYGRRDQHPSWEAFWEVEWHALLASVPATLPASLADLVRRVEGCVERWRPALREGPAVLVHGDLWLGNVLIHDGRIAALLDFENALQAPRDYELLRLEQFGLYPNDYAAAGDEVYCSADFVDCFVLLKRHYPELFAIPHLKERLALYHILDALRSCFDGPGGEELAIYPLAKASNMLLDHGARMFYR